MPSANSENQSSISRRKFMGAVGVGASTVAINAAFGSDSLKKLPNIVYMFSDTHRWGAMSFTQIPQVHTPNLEKMRDKGVCFDRCYVNLPICSPYRAILFTGRLPYEQGLIANHMNLKECVDMAGGTKTHGTMAWAFKGAGYQTPYFGKWHLGGKDVRPFGYDFSIVWNATNNHTKCSYNINGGKTVKWTGESNAIATVDQSLEWIDNHYQEPEPFFVTISLNPPHGPMGDAPPEKMAMYPDEKTIPLHPLDELKNFNAHQGYHAHVSVIDDQVGRMMQKLEDLGIAEDTIFVYTSDHGGMAGVKGVSYGQKRHPEDESSRVPFLIQWPGVIPANVQMSELFSTVDIFPTLCGITNLKYHLEDRRHSADLTEKQNLLAANASNYVDTLRGVNLAQNILGEEGGPEPKSVFLMHTSNMNNNGSRAEPIFRAVVTKQHMYAVHPEGEYCLYDHDEGYQRTNLIDDPKLESVRNECRKELAMWIAKEETPYIENWFKKTPKHWMDKWYGDKGSGNRETGDRGIFDLDKALGSS